VRHPLSGAFKRVDRADVHIQELKALVQRFKESNQDKLRAYKHPTEPQILQFLVKPGQKVRMGIKDEPFINIPEDAPILVGETVYNLRAALDYLVYELSGRRSGTQFPIEDCKLSKDGKYGFDTRRKTYLNGLTDAQVEAIESLQPYVGCTWAQTLRDISNPDKHRHLTAINARSKQIIVVNRDVVISHENRPEKTGVPHPERYLDLEYLIDIAFPDRTPVVEVLQFLKGSVAGAIKIFESEF
jgi:hypothetical protein